MIHLRPMQAHEFADYLAYFLPDYAAEISSNYDQDIVAARAQAEQEVHQELQLGVDTPGQVLLCIVKDDDDGNTPVGYLWCKPDQDGPSVFISDFFIKPQQRGNGYAKLALAALEAVFAKTGHSEVKLRVAADNETAQRLYLSAGFRATGINMRKSFGKA
ncbi:MAG: GNAT family N-acetyltransferase [Paracoccaceae bacterium]